MRNFLTYQNLLGCLFNGFHYCKFVVVVFLKFDVNLTLLLRSNVHETMDWNGQWMFDLVFLILFAGSICYCFFNSEGYIMYMCWKAIFYTLV